MSNRTRVGIEPWGLAGFATGVVLGAALGLLLAPARGRDSRRSMAMQGRAARASTSRVLRRNRELLAIVRREGVRGIIRRRATSMRSLSH